MTKVMFSIHVGDSVAHVLRTRSVAKYLLSKGYDIMYSIPRKALRFIRGYIDEKNINLSDQSYSYAQFPIQQNILDSYYHHAVREAMIYKQYKPNILIGDIGLIAHAYKPQVPFIKILDRFYVELDSELDSPYSPAEKSLIRSQGEELINQTRRRLSIAEDFTYYEFAKPPALIIGASYFVDDIKPPYKVVGKNMTLKPPLIQKPNYEKCFVAFGTGLSDNRVNVASDILKKIEKRFKNIYVSYGTKIHKSKLYQPANAVMKPLFTKVPEDIGVLICHGGSGTIHLGAELGIPIVAIPLQIEQVSNAYRMQKLGFGVNAGTYNKLNFKGAYEETQVEWNIFEDALDNLKNIRKIGKLKDNLGFDHKLLSKSIEEFISITM